jgi:hypothetical protein
MVFVETIAGGVMSRVRVPMVDTINKTARRVGIKLRCPIGTGGNGLQSSEVSVENRESGPANRK